MGRTFELVEKETKKSLPLVKIDVNIVASGFLAGKIRKKVVLNF
jgi:hypothetical protein